MSSIPLPAAEDVRRMLSMLYDGLTVDDSSPAKPDGSGVVAIYLDDQEVPVAAAVADYCFAAFTGAALTRIPVGGAEDAAASGDLGESIFDNVREVFNICSRLLMTSESPHLRLGAVYAKREQVPAEHDAILAEGTSQADFLVDVPNYGIGRVSFLGA